MLINITLFILYFYLVFFSVLGYGFLFCKFCNILLSSISIGIVGLAGLFILTFISYLTNFFFSHNFFHNLVIISFGFFFIFYQFFSNKFYLKKEFIKIFLISLLFIIGIFLSKNNEDFSYYHFAYIKNLTENKIQFGLANFNSGFGTQSSIFYFSSLLYLPIIKYYLINLHGLIILIFSNIFFLDNFFFNKKNNVSFIKILSFFSFVFINLFFSRLAEYGTDRAGQIIVFIIIIIFLNNLIKKFYSEENVKILLILIIYVLSIKSYFLIYTFLLILILVKYTNNLKKFFFNNVNLLFILILFLFLFFSVNIANTGCIIFPLPSSCFASLFWSVPLDGVIAVNNWFELWSKAGATPNYVVENKIEYLQNFNWVPNWIKNYFFTKGSDTIGGIFTIILFFIFLFKSKRTKKNILPELKYLYFFLIILLIIWFNKHPDLRYGGYVLISLLFFIPASVYLSKYRIKYKYTNLKIFLLVTIIVLSFNIRNCLRIISEFNREDIYKFNNFPFFSEEYLKTNINFGLLQKPVNINGYKFYTKK